MYTKSQSPQTGQFNSYVKACRGLTKVSNSLNPLKRVNSILTKCCVLKVEILAGMSQSPQTGQFNSYAEGLPKCPLTIIMSQSPQTGQFNSYNPERGVLFHHVCVRSQSPQTGQFNSYTSKTSYGII